MFNYMFVYTFTVKQWLNAIYSKGCQCDCFVCKNSIDFATSVVLTANGVHLSCVAFVNWIQEKIPFVEISCSLYSVSTGCRVNLYVYSWRRCSCCYNKLLYCLTDRCTWGKHSPVHLWWNLIYQLSACLYTLSVWSSVFAVDFQLPVYVGSFWLG